MMTLEQIGALAILWYEAEEVWRERITTAPYQSHLMAELRMIVQHTSLHAAIRDYKLLEEAKGKGVNDGTV